MTKSKELKELGKKALLEKLKSAQKDLINLKADMSLRKLKNVVIFKEKRKEVARILTFLKGAQG